MSAGSKTTRTPAKHNRPELHPARFVATTGQEKRQTWMVSFADLMAILLTFMVIVFSTKELRPTSWQDISRSMQGAFYGEGRSTAPTRRGAGNDRTVARLVEEMLPDLAASGGVKTTHRGVEVDLYGVAASAESVADLGDLLASLDRTLLVSVITPLATGSPTTIKRILAWEKGLADAYAMRSGLMASDLARRPGISVSVAESGTARATLVIEKSRGANL